MYVYEKMNSNVATVEPSFSVSKAFQIMTDTKHSQLPVIDSKKQLLGLVTEKLLAEVNPSKATSLSVYEINYLLSKTKVSDIMRTGIFKINQNKLIEEAAIIMKENHIGCLPVVDDNNVLVGIVTRVDIFKGIIDLMGIKTNGTRIVMKTESKNIRLSQITDIAEKNNIEIKAISVLENKSYNEVIIKTSAPKTESFIKELEALGYEIIKAISEN